MGLAVGIDDGFWRKDSRNKCCLDLFGVLHPFILRLCGIYYVQ
jgi:hypothetical protein